jgi:small conductance mechanosensitive channel
VGYEVCVLTSLLLTAFADPSPSPAPTIPACQTDAFCQYVYDRTGLDWLAEGGLYLLVKPARILLIIIIALIARQVLQRTVTRLTRSATDDRRPGLLRPLRERITPGAEALVVRSERRRQRAEALGSVLRSFVSVTIFTVAIMLILGEVGVNLAPLIASAGIAGVALGFGAQNLVKDFIAGLFMLLEDQYGVGDLVDVGEATGTVEAVGLRITTIRDARGVLWYIRNGEIVRVGNRSQGWALVIVDVPVGFAGVEEATGVLRAATSGLREDRDFADDLLEAPEVLGVEQITLDGAVVRVTAKTHSDAQWRVARELRQRLTEAIEEAGITRQMTANRVFVQPAHPTQPGPPPPTEPTASEQRRNEERSERGGEPA